MQWGCLSYPTVYQRRYDIQDGSNGGRDCRWFSSVKRFYADSINYSSHCFVEVYSN